MQRSSKFVGMALVIVLLAGMTLSAQDLDVDALAASHWDAVVSEDGAMAVYGNVVAPAYYAEDAYLNWNGGPLDGHYKANQIGEVWSKFFVANDPISYEVVTKNVSEGFRSVTAEIIFTVSDGEKEKKIPVDYMLAFSSDGLIRGEEWTLDSSILEK